MSFPRKSFIGLVAALIFGFALIQLYPITPTNPPVEMDVPANSDAKEVLRRACYDCHSNETRWPWYSRVAPVSWLVERDVREGREALNFSTWNRYSTQERIELMAEGWEEVEEGEMPPWFYLPAHRDAILAPRDESLLRAWALGFTPSAQPLATARDDLEESHREHDDDDS